MFCFDFDDTTTQQTVERGRGSPKAQMSRDDACQFGGKDQRLLRLREGARPEPVVSANVFHAKEKMIGVEQAAHMGTPSAARPAFRLNLDEDGRTVAVQGIAQPFEGLFFETLDIHLEQRDARKGVDSQKIISTDHLHGDAVRIDVVGENLAQRSGAPVSPGGGWKSAVSVRCPSATGKVVALVTPTWLSLRCISRKTAGKGSKEKTRSAWRDMKREWCPMLAPTSKKFTVPCFARSAAARSASRRSSLSA